MIITPEDYAKTYNATAHALEVSRYNELFDAHENELKRYFINSSDAGLFDWLRSKGTSYPCYIQWLMQQDKIKDIDGTINVVRNIIYAIAKPLQSQFFYWTLLLLILHKFNFRKPVMKVILAHYVLRVVGDILEQLGLLMNHYFSMRSDGTCIAEIPSVEYHPLRWLLTRQIGMIFWYFGEIAGDWYPLLRTKAVARDQRSIWYVYVTCALFNISKVVIIVLYWLRFPTEIYNSDGTYDEEGNNRFYNIYWACQGVVLFFSFFYDLTVYLVLKRQIFNKSNAEFGFLKKFRSISEYRMAISAFIGLVGLPVVFGTLLVKYYFLYDRDSEYSRLNFSFEDIRLLISNVQYYMIFIDQILLFRSRDGSSLGDTTTSVTTSPYNSNNFSNNNGSGGNTQMVKPYNIDSKLYYSNLNSLNNTLVNSQGSLVQYSNSGSLRMKNNNNIIRNNSDYSHNHFNRNNSIGNYDDYNGTGNEWNYLRR